MYPCQTIAELAERYSEFVVSRSDFHYGREIGNGGYSRVFIGIQRSTGIVCAMKEMKHDDISGVKLIPYETEISILSVCKNTFTPKFIGFTAEYPYTIITEYVPNGDLYNALKLMNEGVSVLSGTRKTIISLCMAKGMCVMSSNNFIHRDLKSMNILLDMNYLPIICDFGISKNKNYVINEAERHFGTPNWMAPELFEGKEHDDKVDVYSFGMILWEMLSGNIPFKGKKNEEISYLVCVKNQRPSFPILTPTPLKQLITNCWNSDPKKRPSFEEIYKMFVSHKVKFNDTDDKAIDDVVEYIKLLENNFE